MCTITLAWQAFADSPVIVVANRDEYLDRPSEPPTQREWEKAVIAPKDSEASGTWIGYNEDGVLVALTNRWIEGDIDGDRSRGLLVRDALKRESAEEAARYVERDLDERTYDGFNLIAVDATAALLVEFDGVRRVRNLEPGVQVIVNVGANSTYDIPATRESDGRKQAENANKLQEALTPEPGETGNQWADRARKTIADHEYGVCLHGEVYGTRSSSVIRMGTERITYQYADGPPCETEFEPVAADLSAEF